MKRRGLIALGGVATLAACAIGHGGSVYYSGPVTANFDGSRFRNPEGLPPRGFGDLLRWQLGDGKVAWPESHPSPFPPDQPPGGSRGLRVAMVGHASLLIQGGGVNILTDPVWSERASPLSFTGPKRVNPPGIGFDDLPPIHAVLVSHAHYDHLDVATLGRLWARHRPRIIAPLGNDAIIRASVPESEVTAADWGDTIALGEARVHCVPVHHWSARGVLDRNHALWCGFVIEGIGGRVFFAGDTGFDGGRPFREAASRHGAPDLALLPIGAYAPRWFMAPQHMDPADAVRGMGLLGARQALGYHWGTFRLTDEGVEDPSTELAAALAGEGIAPARFLALRPGEVWQPIA